MQSNQWLASEGAGAKGDRIDCLYGYELIPRGVYLEK